MWKTAFALVCLLVLTYAAEISTLPAGFFSYPLFFLHTFFALLGFAAVGSPFALAFRSACLWAAERLPAKVRFAAEGRGVIGSVTRVIDAALWIALIPTLMGALAVAAAVEAGAPFIFFFYTLPPAGIVYFMLAGRVAEKMKIKVGAR